MPRCTSRLVLILLCLAPGGSALDAQPWKILTSGIDTNLRGISAVKIPSTGNIAIWASGSHGIILRSLDDGATWTRLSIPGQPDLDFRGIVAISDSTAYLMSSGEGDKSRIYKTSNSGQSWEQQYTDISKSFFLDSIACLSEKICFALGDPVNGKFLILQTNDGQRWIPFPPKNLPDALPKEGAFAASNSNLLVVSETELYLVTGGFAARVLHTFDGGKTWLAYSVPLAADNGTSGIFSITHGSDGRPAVVGGDYANPTLAIRTAAFFNPIISEDSAKSWQCYVQQPSGYRSAVVSFGAQTFLAVGPTGADLSQDSGLHWTPFPSLPLNAAFALDANHVYAAGPKGAISQFLPADLK